MLSTRQTEENSAVPGSSYPRQRGRLFGFRVSHKSPVDAIARARRMRQQRGNEATRTRLGCRDSQCSRRSPRAGRGDRERHSGICRATCARQRASSQRFAFGGTHRQSEHSSVALQNEVGALTPLTCPDCGGPLWRAKSGPLRFRCLVGHAHSAGSMESGQRRNLERALWAAIRQFEQGRSRVVSSYRERAAQARQNGEALRALLLTAANKSRMPLDWSPSPVKSRYHATSLPPGLPLRSVRCRPRTRCRPVSYPD